MFFKGRSVTSLALVTCVIGGVAASLNIVPNRYIVETSGHSVLSQLGTEGEQRRSFYDHNRKRDVFFALGEEFNVPGIFVGGTLQVTDGEDVSALLEVDGVVAVRPVHWYPAPKPVSMRELTGPNDPTAPDPFSTHILTGVDKAHAQGLTGKGIKIGIIDSGVDYTHPTLGGGFGPGFKIAGGYDFVGDNFNGSNTPVQDADPLDQCGDHGTHVAGIIGANPGNEYNIRGVAYDASLYAYKIFGCNGTTTDTIIIDALLRAFNDGMDIITLSLGAPNGFSWDAGAVVASRIAKSGKVVTIAAGNDGESGTWYMSAPSTGTDVIAVGSVDNTITPIQNVTVHVNDEEVSPIQYFNTMPLINETAPFEIYATSTNTSSTDDACEPLPEDTPDLTGKVVIIHRGTCAFVEKFEHAAKFGASLFLVYNDDRPFNSISTGDYTAALIPRDSGVFLVKNFAQGNKVTVSFKNRPTGLVNTATGGIMSSFSSLGPTYELDFKPAVSAPGGDIISTFPLNRFGLSSGTSMATPLVAGSAALILQARGNTKTIALAMRDILESTVSPIPSNLTDEKPLQTLIRSGAGLIQVDRAANTKTLVHPGHFALNDTAHFQPTQTFTVTNLGTEAVTYSLGHAPVGTIYTYNGLQPVVPPFELTTDYATVEFSKARFTVDPGQSSTITVIFTPPAIDAEGYPAYSGHIEVTSPSETLRISYLGVLGSVHEQPLLDRSDTAFGVPLPLIQLPDGSIQTGATNYTFTDGDYPTLVSGLLFGSPRLTLDLVTADSEEGSDPKVVTNYAFGEALARTPAGTFINITVFETTDNGTVIPDGEYRLFLKTLKIFGNPDDPKDSETYLSPIIGKFSAPPPSGP